MAVIKITNFGGEVPRRPARNLQNGEAVLNQNLLATSQEFRPLADDSIVGSPAVTAPIGAKTLYRTTKAAGGAIRTSDSDGWITSTGDFNYVKSQLADNTTERTYASDNTGASNLQVTDNTGTYRVLGVWAPPKLTITTKAVSQFTSSDANNWYDNTFLPAVSAVVRNALVVNNSIRLYVPTITSAPPLTLSGDGAYYSCSQSFARDNDLDDPRLKGYVGDTGDYRIPIRACPVWIQAGSTSTIAADLLAIKNPAGTASALTSAQANAAASAVTAAVSLTDPLVAPIYTKLTAAITAFKTAVYFTPAATSSVTLTAPIKPTVSEYVTTGGVGADNVGATSTRHPEWVAYDAALAAYNTQVRNQTSTAAVTAADKAAKIAAISSAQAEAEAAFRDMEALRDRKIANIAAATKEYMENIGLIKSASNPDGLVTVDPDVVMEDRFYFATYVTDWGEESAPSPVDPATDKINIDQNDEVEVTIAAPTQAYQTISKWRLYRTSTGTASTEFQLVIEQAISNRTYKDTLKAVQLGEVCPSITWSPPPFRTQGGATPYGQNPYARGLVGMPNGIMAAFFDNVVAFCEPYVPYAWPVEYQVSIEYPIVGLGVCGQSLFVGTKANPYIISGSDSASMSAIKLDSTQSCASRASITSANGGVIYASYEGLCFAAPNQVQLLTEGLFSKEDWVALGPENITAVFYDSVYYFWTLTKCYALDTTAKKLTQVAGTNASAVFYDAATNSVFYTASGYIKRLYGSTSRRLGAYTSGVFVLPAQQPFAWLQVDGDQTASLPATIYLVGDGTTFYTANITSTTPVRVPSGRYLEVTVRVESRSRITKVMLASTTEELKSA